jgi:myosin-crossreactive antigen
MLEIGKTYKCISSEDIGTTGAIYRFSKTLDCYIQSSKDFLIEEKTRFKVIAYGDIQTLDGDLVKKFITECTNNKTEDPFLCCFNSSIDYFGRLEEVETEESNHDGMIYNPYTDTWNWF